MSSYSGFCSTAVLKSGLIVLKHGDEYRQEADVLYLFKYLKFSFLYRSGGGTEPKDVTVFSWKPIKPVSCTFVALKPCSDVQYLKKALAYLIQELALLCQARLPTRC